MLPKSIRKFDTYSFRGDQSTRRYLKGLLDLACSEICRLDGVRLRDASAENPMPESEFADLLASIAVGIVESVARRGGAGFDPTKLAHMAFTPIDAPQ